MRSRIGLTFLALTVASLPAVAQQAPTNGAPTAQSIAAAVQSHYASFAAVDVDFVQSSHNALAPGNEPSRNGHAVFVRGGALRMEYSTPAGDVIVSDGTSLWAHDQAARQTLCSAAPSGLLAATMGVFTGQANLTSNFTPRLLDAQRYQFSTGNVLELTPNPAIAGLARLLLYIDGASARVVRLVTFDAQGNRSRYDFDHERGTAAAPAASFTFANPAGSQLVRAQGYTGPC